MFKGEFRFNMNKAIAPSGRQARYQYAQGYHTTNEPLAEIIPLTPTNDKRVLTVAASGDQPLMYAAAGASHIDTFDITINACAIMDFKVSALQFMSHTEYSDAIYKLSSLNDTDSIDAWRQIDAYKPIVKAIENMPGRTRTLMHNIISQRKDAIRNESALTIFPTYGKTYAKIQQAINGPFNFIWADLMHVSNYTQHKYDIINISNIFDHFVWNGRPRQDLLSTIEILWSHLNVGGHLICTTTSYDILWDIFGRLSFLLPKLHTNISFPSVSDSFFSPIIIQKTR